MLTDDWKSVVGRLDSKVEHSTIVCPWDVRVGLWLSYGAAFVNEHLYIRAIVDSIQEL